MGNSPNPPKISTEIATIFWLDQNVYNEDNKYTYEKYLPKLKNFNFFCFTSVDDLINYIQNKDNINYFEFKPFYVIVSGRLAENFCNEYVKLIERQKYRIIANIIVYCFLQKEHEKKPYFKDDFLNAGKITSRFEDVANYILNNESEWKNIDKYYEPDDPAKENLDNYGDNFMIIDTSKEYELALPILISKTINSSLIKKDEIINFQNKLLKKYCKSYKEEYLKLIKPLGIKNMNIPLHILTKFFIKFFTAEKLPNTEGKNFYQDLNFDLSHDKFDEYHPFIFLIYDGLNKKFIQSYKKKVYRGANISKKELGKLLSNYNEIQKNIDGNKKNIYYSKQFSSFSKDINEAYNFLFQKNKKDDPKVLFIIEECKKEDFYVTNIDLDIESLSACKTEKEVLILPLTCFEITKIEQNKTYKNVTNIYLNYLDKYQDKIESKIKELKEKNDENAIRDFFQKSMKSQFGKSVKKCYNRKERLSSNFSAILEAPPNNSYFINQIALGFISQSLKGSGNSKDQTAAHMDDEFPNLKKEYECRASEDKDKCLIEKENYFAKFLNEKLRELNVDTEIFDNNFSIGYCIGNFLANFGSFKKAPTREKVLNIVYSLFACGPHIIKLLIKNYPKIKSIIENNTFNLGNISIDAVMALEGLNILISLSVEFYYVIKYQYQYKKWKSSLLYVGKRTTKILTGIGFSVIGNLITKAVISGFIVLTGISVTPFVTITLQYFGSGICGYLGNNVGNYLGERIFGKDEFKLTSAHIYYKYIPKKYRECGNNPHLAWDKSHLCANVKSYIIECIINDTETQMRIINIPNNIFELPECLGCDCDNECDLNNSFDTNCSSYESENENNYKKCYDKKNKFIGDLIIPYKGIKDNAYKIDFVIYGINKKEISNKEWIDFRDKESKKKLIEIGYIYSVY